MGFFDRMATGWELSKVSFKVLRAHKELVIFPVLSGVSLLIILCSCFTALWAASGWDIENLHVTSRLVGYSFVFLVYLVNYFVVVFFNMALMHCARLYFDGEEVSVSRGIQFSFSRIGVIFSWALFAATVGTLLRAIQDNFGWIGKLITGILGFVWGVATFFVVPILAYEELGPVDAVKRSKDLMAQKWGEGLGATFSFGIIQFLAILFTVTIAVLLALTVNLYVGIVFGVLCVVTIMAVMSAANSIFISAVYEMVNGKQNKYFDEAMVDDIFAPRG